MLQMDRLKWEAELYVCEREKGIDEIFGKINVFFKICVSYRLFVVRKLD